MSLNFLHLNFFFSSFISFHAISRKINEFIFNRIKTLHFRVEKTNKPKFIYIKQIFIKFAFPQWNTRRIRRNMTINIQQNNKLPQPTWRASNCSTDFEDNYQIFYTTTRNEIPNQHFNGQTLLIAMLMAFITRIQPILHNHSQK